MPRQPRAQSRARTTGMTVETIRHEEAVAIVTDAMPNYRAAAAESGLDGS